MESVIIHAILVLVTIIMFYTVVYIDIISDKLKICIISILVSLYLYFSINYMISI